MSLTLSEIKRNKKQHCAFAFIGLFFFLASGLSLLSGSKNLVIVFAMMYGACVTVKFSILVLFAAYPALLARTNWFFAGAIASIFAVAAGLLLTPQYVEVWLILCNVLFAVIFTIYQVRHLTGPPSSSIVC